MAHQQPPPQQPPYASQFDPRWGSPSMPPRPPWLEAEKSGPAFTRRQARWIVVLATAFVAIFLYWTVIFTIALIDTAHHIHQDDTSSSDGPSPTPCNALC